MTGEIVKISVGKSNLDSNIQECKEVFKSLVTPFPPPDLFIFQLGRISCDWDIISEAKDNNFSIDGTCRVVFQVTFPTARRHFGFRSVTISDQVGVKTRCAMHS